MTALLILAADRQGQDPGGFWGVGVIIGTVVLVAIILALVYLFLLRRTRRERTAQGTHRAGPGRTSADAD